MPLYPLYFGEEPGKVAKKEKLPEYVFSVTVVGESGVGKTSLCQRYTDNIYGESFPTVGVDHYTKRLHRGDKIVKLDIWDTPGRFNRVDSLFPNFFRSTHAVLIVYDLTNQTSFNRIENWMNMARDFTPQKAHFFLVGSKCEMNNRAISHCAIENCADRLKLPTYEISACASIGLEQLFHDVVQLSLRSNPVPSSGKNIVLKKTESNVICEGCWFQ